MSGFAPVGGPGLAPRAGEVDWDLGVARFLERASTKGRLGVRVGLLLVVTAPLWLWGRLRSGASLAAEERARLLDAMLSHRFFFVRELTLLLKLVACMALFRVEDVRARSGYDPAPAERAPRVQKKLALPVVQAPAVREVA